MNAPPTGWPAAYRSILGSARFAIELTLAAANRNNCRMAAETIAILRLTTTVASSSHSRQKLCTKNRLKSGQIGHPRSMIQCHISLILHIIIKFLHTSPRETPIQTRIVGIRYILHHVFSSNGPYFCCPQDHWATDNIIIIALQLFQIVQPIMYCLHTIVYIDTGSKICAN